MSTRTAYFFTLMTGILLLLLARTAIAQESNPTNGGQSPSSEAGQTVVDLTKVQFAPLKSEGVPPGPEIAVLRGSMTAGPVEVLIRLPANYTFPNHSHSSDETYLWLKGPFTYVGDDGKATKLGGQTFIGLPPHVPHALICGSKPCLLYVRYSQTFDMKIHPMPKVK